MFSRIFNIKFKTNHLYLFVIFALILFIYCLTFSKIPTSDGATWVSTIDAGLKSEHILPTHVLNLYVLFALKIIFQFLGLPISTLGMIQVTNAVLVSLTAGLLFKISIQISSNKLIAVLAAVIFSFSFGVWFFTNGEMHYFSVPILLFIFLLLGDRLQSNTVSMKYVMVIGILLGVAILFHLDTPFFIFVIFFMLLTRHRFQDAFQKTVLIGFISGIIWICIAILIRSNLDRQFDIIKFFRWMLGSAVTSEGRSSFALSFAWFNLFKTIKGQAVCIFYGSEALIDLIQNQTFIKYHQVKALSILSILYFSLFSIVILKSFVFFRKKNVYLRTYLVGALAWVLVYNFGFNLWYAPEWTEYHIVSVPPLVILLVLGTYAFLLSQKRKIAFGLLISIFLLTIGINFWFGILSWLRYNYMVYDIRAKTENLIAGDNTFLSFESGLDPIFDSHGRIDLKGLFLENSKDKAFNLYQKIIQSKISEKGVVYGYNLIPSDFAIKKMEYRSRATEEYEREEFEFFLNQLKSDYRFEPLFLYWGVNKNPLYLFNVEQSTFWKISKKT